MLVKVIIASIITGHIYYCYRYAFQINDENTSPTYSGTPLILQAARYAIDMSIYAIAILCSFSKAEAVRNKGSVYFMHLLAWLVIGCILIFKATQSGLELDVIASVVKSLYVVPIGMLVLLVPPTEKSLKTIIKWIVLYPFFYHTAYNFVQVVLYLTTGRLTALAYEGGFIRFGGGWDDPNGFGLYCVMVITWSLVNIGRNKNIAFYGTIATLGLVQLLGTISYSSFFAFACAGVMLIILVKSAIVRSIALCGIILLLALASFKYAAILDAYDSKLESANLHVEELKYLDSFFASDTLELLFGKSGVVTSESEFIYIFTNFGFVGLMVVLSFFIWFLNRIRGAYLIRRRQGSDNFFETCLVFGTITVVAVLAGSLGIPSLTVYPVNLFFWILIFTMIQASAAKGGLEKMDAFSSS